jgi:hypothetical protein
MPSKTAKEKELLPEKALKWQTGDILCILDANLTVPPEELPKFCDAIASGKAEFINGCRLVYPLEDEAMRSLNILGNKFFGLMFTWLLDQKFKDTLCGTKVILKEITTILLQTEIILAILIPLAILT